jgi:hypothetical protein
MSFEILYVEDVQLDWKRLDKAVKEQSKKGFPLSLQWAQTVEEVEHKLTLSTRLVLADVYFPESPSRDSDKVDKLDHIIRSVEEWSTKNGAGRPLPIIAYTSRGKAALEECLRRRRSLYDIWDKSSASPEYVAWRLSELAKEVSRTRPDARTQRLIREMKPGTGATWHTQVVEMTTRYDSGWTEYDQIERAGQSIRDIAVKIGVYEQCSRLWEAMVKWEPLSRAISRKTRGHARHVINVFWLGYYLLHHKALHKLFAEYWKSLVLNRRNMKAVADVDPLEALSNSWFFAGLFHDVGGCVEHANTVSQYVREVDSIFGDLSPEIKDSHRLSPEAFKAKANSWLHDFGDELADLVWPIVERSFNEGRTDQGVIGAIHLREVIDETIDSGKARCYALEGGRAMSLHNIFPKLETKDGILPVSWDTEPLVCLLLLCDQLQTWDRETGTQTLSDGDFPSRAELSHLSFGTEKGRPGIKMAIDYIAPAHLDHSLELYTKVKDRLVEVLRQNPYSALNRIRKPWPFRMTVQCTLSGDRLEEMTFGD